MPELPEVEVIVRGLKKNILDFRGKPLLAHSIIYAKKSSIVNDVIVSTDSEEFASISNKFGARTPFLRPSSLSGDTVQDYPVVNHAVNFLENENKCSWCMFSCFHNQYCHL